jgi:hypothetical protein
MNTSATSGVGWSRHPCLLTTTIARNRVWTLMAEESVSAAELLAAYTLRLDVGMFRRVVAPRIVRASEDERAQVADISTVRPRTHIGDCLVVPSVESVNHKCVWERQQTYLRGCWWSEWKDTLIVVRLWDTRRTMARGCRSVLRRGRAGI